MTIGGHPALWNRGPITILGGFCHRGIRIMIGVAALVAGALSASRANAALIPTTDGTMVYDAVNNITWIANGNLAAAQPFGLPTCQNGAPMPCINASGTMRYTAAQSWIAAMNRANYLGHSTWQLPTTPIVDNSCQFVGPQNNSFGFKCTASAMGSLYYTAFGLTAPATVAPIPPNRVGPFSNFQPYLYWSQSPSSAPGGGNATFSFNSGFQGANTAPNYLYVLPMIPGKLAGTPAPIGTGLQTNPGGSTVYDPVTNVTWLANADLAATNTFGIHACQFQGHPDPCVNSDGAMDLNGATAFIAAMNTAAYLGQTNWQLPTIGQDCTAYQCTANDDPMAELFNSQLGLGEGTPVVLPPNVTTGPFHNIQPYLYFSCEAPTIQSPCQTAGPASNFEWSFSFGNGFLGTDLLQNEFYIFPYFVGAPANLCLYTLSSAGQSFTAVGGMGTITITTTPTCTWTVSGLPSWVTLTSPFSGTGPGTVTFTVSPNTGQDLSGSFTIAGATFTIDQEAASISGLTYIGSMPHIAAQENWITTFTLVDKGATSAIARLNFFSDPTGLLTLPLTFPQQPATSGPLLASSIDNTIFSNALLIVESAGPQKPPVQIGSAQLSASGNIDGFAIFHLIPGAQEAVVPMETRNANSYLLAFDNTGGVVLGVALANVSSQAGNVGTIIRDDTGTPLTSGSIQMSANGHTSFVLSQQYPATANKRGTIEFDKPPGGQISVLGIRTTPLGSTNTLTTIPALANVGTNGGSIAHIATGDGWQTTFVLVNTGSSAAQVNLKFFADVTGNPLSLPISFPQVGSAVTTASSFNQTLAAGATLLVQSAAPLSNPAPTTGSAQLITNGNVSGFVIFRYNPNGQEAVVPLETRTANGFILAFDNTGGTATGIAINSVSSQAINVPVIVRDDTGAQIASDTLNLAANGHLAFTLATDKYPATANNRGTIEFDMPPGGQIGALGIRIPVAHTFTTLPALAK